MKKSTSCLKYVAIVIVCSLAGFVLGIAFGFTPGNPDSITWQQVPAPPERPVAIIEIGGYGRSPGSLFVVAGSGIQYECCGPSWNVWKQVEYNRTRYDTTCKPSDSSLFLQLPGSVLDCMYISQFEWTTEQYYVALLEDGSLWRWHYYYGMNTALKTIFWCTLAGLAAGLIFVAIKVLSQKVNLR